MEADYDGRTALEAVLANDPVITITALDDDAFLASPAAVAGTGAAV